jgi:hypothetical protein
MPPKEIEYSIWVLSSLLPLLTAGQLWLRTRCGTHRTFIVYLVFVALHGLLNLFLSLTDPVLWFYSVYAGNVLTTLLGFAVLFETGKAALSAKSFRLSRSTFMVLCSLLAILAVVFAAQMDVKGPTFIRARILFEVALRVTQIGILGIFAVVSVVFGFFWKRLEFGIVLGYGLYASAQLPVMYLRAAGNGSTLLLFVPVVTYLVATIIWLVYACAREVEIDTDAQGLISAIDRSLDFARKA